MTRKKIISFFRKKKTGLTPSVAAPDDTNPSDTTGNNVVLALKGKGNGTRGLPRRTWIDDAKME